MTKKLKLCTPVAPAGAATQATPGAVHPGERKHQRLIGHPVHTPPAGARPEPGTIPGLGRSLVPVSAVARHWGISPRRVRQMLEQGRLEGQQRDNGYWEVLYPYRYLLGTRGPRMSQHREKAAPGSLYGGYSKHEYRELKAELNQKLV